MIIDWSEPASNGAEITAYIIYIRSVDSSIYNTYTTYCDGSDPAVVLNTQCSIPSAAFLEAPHSLQWGASIYAKVVAINLEGQSVESYPGNGAIILMEPDAPYGLFEQTEFRTKSILSFAWTKGAAEGGTPVTGYYISMAEQGGEFSYLVTDLTSTSFTVVSLTAGITYEFKVQAKNAYGLSAFSETLTLLCAFKPEVSIPAPTTTNYND